MLSKLPDTFWKILRRIIVILRGIEDFVFTWFFYPKNAGTVRAR
jgi:hypothetical protein